MSNDRVCALCHGPVTPCESCPHGFDEWLCDEPTSGHYGEHVETLSASAAPVDVLPCPRCHQLAAPGTGAICDRCRELERTPQGERLSLFTPAPTVPAGSLTMF